MRVRLELTEGRALPVLVYNQGVVSITREARDFLASAKGVEGITAGAFVLNSPVGSFIGNFFLAVHQPKVPARIFRKTEDALRWLEKFRHVANG